MVYKLKVLEQCKISPPPCSAANSRPSLPLTFFDIIFHNFHPVQRVFFYETSLSTSIFLLAELPKLKKSLALTLNLFYPLAGKLKRTSDGQQPQVLCSDDDDFVWLTVAVSGDDFYDLAGYHAREVSRFHPLVPTLQYYGNGRAQAVLAIQLTIFPNVGVAIGTTLHHAVADGSSYTHFMKTWARVHKHEETTRPFLDRSVVLDPKGLKGRFLKDLEEFEDDTSFDAWDLTTQLNVVRATFVFSNGRLAELKSKTKVQCSPYALACGFAWAGLVHARRSTSKVEHFGFVTGCRARSDPPIPSNYFGNCLGICCVEAKRSDLVGVDGAVVAAEAIWRVIKSLEDGAFRYAGDWIKNVRKYAAARAVTVAGSPKLAIYEVDFGWGSLRKVEIVSIERTGALGLAESREEEGGIEVGLALPRHEMEAFIAFYDNNGVIFGK
ncbi:malonyl-coenzyme:anthocyanin 5-O-glucoside-6'''-O-malonyltransferase-like [Typha latifolia]|uniref:malonyl-coenzyme:anthocyanin 5-O-glucoside-6'''-O-malonyltransferase-like n=1 Tax=Typha latifolia TaxID=4733 RepID=UPI003C3020F4